MAAPRGNVAENLRLARGRLTDRPMRALWPLALVLVWAGLAVMDSVFSLPSGASPASPPAGQHGKTGVTSQHQPARHRHRHRRPAAASPHPTPVISLVPVGVTAYGPRGAASGDNQATAAEAIDGSLETAWQSDWYRSAEFGSLQAGTGLLLDMGHPVRITRVTIVLGRERGADLALAAERVPGLLTGPGQATARDVGGTVRLKLARPRRQQYLLIWFTRLPPDPAGTFQANVYNIAVDGKA